MSVIVKVMGLPDQEWRMGQPIPKLSGAVTVFYADGAELLALNSALLLLSEQPAPTEGAKKDCPSKATDGPPRPIEEILAERNRILPMCEQHFSEYRSARLIATILSWCINEKGTPPPSSQFGWLETSLPDLMEGIGIASRDALMAKIAELQATNEALLAVENDSSKT